MQLRAVVVDDEAPARQELSYILKELGVEVVRSAGNWDDALQAVNSEKPDIVFLDIELHDELNGLQVAAKLLELEHAPVIIFATAYDKYAVKAFEVNAVDYILKPFDKERIEKTIKRIKKRELSEKELTSKLHKLVSNLQAGEQNRSEIKKITKISAVKNGTIIPIDQSDIIYVWAEGRTSKIKTFDSKFNTAFSFGELLEKLDPIKFLKTHRSYCVNMDKIKEVQPMFKGTFNLVMNDKENSQVPVSRNFSKDLKMRLGI
ncbi:MAG: two-component system, LytTR family, response regulator LytT [Clostridia bacterium]|jgi:DNA-binding LytR/AlgR family response regulator|nr:two component transcriptional regulator, LytTR family [Clostridiales bacterium]MDK2984905.1 two-component system, LytTR family, response regulator LytT [Clostridia bacterium]